jgi:aminoglycoside phosphotransferase
MTGEIVAARLVHEQLGRRATDATAVSGRGTVNTVVVVSTAQGRVVVRIAGRGRDEFDKERWALAEARGAGVRCPEMLAHGWCVAGQERRAFAIQTFVGERDAEEIDDPWPEVGRQLRRLHAVRVSGWGLDMAAPGVFDASWDDHVEYNIASLTDADLLRERGILHASEGSELRALFERVASRSWPLALTHGDVALRNLRVDADGSVWLLDWGCAGADVVPAEDLQRIVFAHDPAGAVFEGLLRGYGTRWSDVRDDVRAISLLSCTDLCRWSLDQCPDRLGYYVSVLRWALDLHLHGSPWSPAPTD